VLLEIQGNNCFQSILLFYVQLAISFWCSVQWLISSNLILDVGRIQFLVIIGLRSCFLLAVSQGPLSASRGCLRSTVWPFQSLTQQWHLRCFLCFKSLTSLSAGEKSQLLTGFCDLTWSQVIYGHLNNLPILKSIVPYNNLSMGV